MSKSRPGALFTLVVALTVALMIVPMTVSSAPDSPTTRIGNITDFLLEWEWEGPSYELAPVIGGDGQTYTRVEVTGYVNRGAPGWPSLPSLGKLVVLPPSGDFGLELVEVEYDTTALEYPIEPAPAPAPLQFDADGNPLPVGWDFADAVYAGAAAYPAAFAALEDPAWMRDLRLARLTITPFRYHPAQQTLDVARRLRLRVVPTSAGEWRPPTDAPAGAYAGTPAHTLDSAILDADAVLNPADVDAFRASNPPILQPAAIQSPPGDYKVLVETEGIYALDYAVLAAVGLPVDSINPATLRLFHGGSEVAAQWDGDGDAAFEYGERLLFYARPQLTRYADYDVYWLAWGGGNGLRMGSRSGDPAGRPAGTAWATALVEENAEYDSLYAGWDGDHWFWRKLKQPGVPSDTITVTLETPAAGVAGELTAWLQGTTRAWTDPDHHVHFNLNGADVGDAWWEGKTAHVATMSVPAGGLMAGDNALVLSLPADVDDPAEGAWVDAITVTYGLSAVSGGAARFRGEDAARAYTVGGFSSASPRVYDVTDPAAPLVVTGWTLAGGAVTVGDGGSAPAEYLIVTDDQIQAVQWIIAAKPLDDPANGADYVVITHPDFVASLAPLVNHRTNRGLQVEVVDVEAIYDHFGDGRMSPEAIHAFLSHAYAAWTPAPLYVLLVGDSTYDPRAYRPDSNLTYLPAYLADVDPWMGETSADSQYADLTGDRLPELRLGRLPVNTPAEVKAIVNKIIAYEAHPARDGWNERLVFGADNPSDAGPHDEDADQQFTTYAAPTSTYGYEGVRVYFSETGGEPHLYTDAETAQAALIAALDEGALLYSYFGHSSWHQEAALETDNYAPLFHVSHIPQLNNQNHWPVVLHMTCFTGYYIHRTDDTLDESLLRTADLGAVAVWGSSGNGVTTDHRTLNRIFYQNVLGAPQIGDEQAELGAIVQNTLVGFYAEAPSYELIDTYHLFGDPAMSLNLVIDLPFSIFLPIIARGA